MINSIPQININKDKKLGGFPELQPNQYWYMPPKSDNVEIKSQFPLDPKVIINPEEARKTKNLTIIGVSIGVATILTAAGLFFFLKGGPRNLPKYFRDFKNYLERKVQKSKLNNEGKLSFKNNVYMSLIKLADSAQRKFEVINNFTSFKDILFKKIMYISKIGSKIHNGITKGFENIGKLAVTGSYRKTSSKIYGLKDVIPENYSGRMVSEVAYINGDKISKEEALKLAKRLNTELFDAYCKNFSAMAINNRYVKFKKALEELKIAFSDLRIFFSKGVYSEFMAEAALHDKKALLQDSVKACRKELSYSVKDMAREIENRIVAMTDLFGYKETDKIKSLRDLCTKVKKYSKNPINNHKLKDQIIEELDTLSTSLREAATSEGSNIENSEKILSELDNIRGIFTEFKQGKLEDILDIYRQLLPENDYKKVEKIYRKAIKSLDKSVKVETEDYTSKLRDLSLGSAPTDILTILGSLGVLGYQLKKSDDKDQRISISLKYGIPALAGIGTALYCNAKLFAGSKALIIASVSSLLVNRLGVFADDMRKKYFPKTQSQNTVAVTTK
ncbi:MAG: hypothetical protein ACI37Q_06185 [Candidatus Gastranaerophilaceae bacterium]